MPSDQIQHCYAFCFILLFFSNVRPRFLPERPLFQSGPYSRVRHSLATFTLNFCLIAYKTKTLSNQKLEQFDRRITINVVLIYLLILARPFQEISLHKLTDKWWCVVVSFRKLLNVLNKNFTTIICLYYSGVSKTRTTRGRSKSFELLRHSSCRDFQVLAKHTRVQRDRV